LLKFAKLKKDAEKRKAGAQTGHRGSGRKLLPEDQMKDIVHHYPDECSRSRSPTGVDSR
jgi:hypothetical protein